MEEAVKQAGIDGAPSIPCGDEKYNEASHVNYDVQIQELDHGYMVRVGCKSFAIESKEILLNMITKYINNPSKVQREFHNKTLTIK